MTASPAPTPFAVLNEKQMAQLSTERRLLDMLQEALVRFDAAPGDLDILRQAVNSLSELFMLVIVGEFNSGKSSFINALLGAKVMPEGVTPTTSQINILRYGPEPSERILEGDIIERTYPADFLRQISVVDTPGTNAIIRRHEQISESFIPRSDLVLFVTSADRPFTESERGFLEKISSWGKKIVVILNKIDLLETPEELQKVIVFIRENFMRLLDLAPEIFPISARTAFRVKMARKQGGATPVENEQGDTVPASALVSPTSPLGVTIPLDGQGQADLAQLWEKSGFGKLETFIFDTLDEESRVKLKLLNPLGVAERLGTQYQEVIGNRLKLLDEDEKTIATIRQQLEAYRAEMTDEFHARLSRVENILTDMERRADEWFEQNIRLTRVRDLIRTEKLSREFEHDVIADTGERIERAVQDLIDWMVDRDLRMWQDIQDYLTRRRQLESQEGIIGQVGGSFDYNRRELLQTVGGAARQVVESYDRQAEADQLALSVREAVTQTALTGVGAVGLGTAIAILVGTAAADVSGILLGGALAGLGLFIIPARRNKARNEFRRSTEDLRDRLHQALTSQFNTEIERSVNRIRDSIAPYTRWVRAESDKLKTMHETFGDLLEEMHALRNKIQG